MQFHVADVLGGHCEEFGYSFWDSGGWGGNNKEKGDLPCLIDKGRKLGTQGGHGWSRGPGDSMHIQAGHWLRTEC